MKFSRYEILFLGYLATLGCATLLSYIIFADFTSLTVEQLKSSTLQFESKLMAITGMFTILVLVGLLGIYPIIRRSVHENGKLSETAQSLSKKSETFEHAALTDSLTGLQNRRYFDDALDQYFQEFSSIGHPLGLIMLDLDHFKKINDTYGHDVGDDVLRGVTNCLLDYTRHHDVVARIGGEEFAILAPNLNERALTNLADRIRVAISEVIFEAEEVRFRVTTSMGLVLWDGKESAASMVKRGDKKLYEAKHTGRNRIAA